MTDIDFILGLIAARASHCFSCSCTTEDEEDWDAERPLWLAKSQALEELQKEITASLLPGSGWTADRAVRGPRTLWVLATEMGGDMTARILTDEAQAIAAQDLYMRDFRMECPHHSHATCRVEEIIIPPRRDWSSNTLDGRFALIRQCDGLIETSIYETSEELDSAKDEFMDRTDYGSDDSNAMCGSHAILVPK